MNVHSAHIGQEVEVPYRWHPLHGKRLPAQYSEQLATGRIIHVEVARGVVVKIPAWMTDAGICAQMPLGVPMVSVEALRDLQRLLAERGFR